MHWTRSLLAFLAVGIGALPRQLDPRAPSNGSCEATSPIVARLDEVFGAAVNGKRVPGIAAIALNRDGSVIFKNSWGTIDINNPASAPAVTAVAALQLIEQEKLGVDDLVEDYIPSWKNISVIDGFTDDGQPILRSPKTKATILNLFTHTSGQTYAFLDDKICRWNAWVANQTGTLPPMPLAADPSTGWFYGGSLDTLGNVVVAISGQRLDVYFEEHVFKDLISRAVPGYGTCGFKPAGDPVGVWNSNDQTLSLSNTFLPGVRKGWTAAFLSNNEDVSEGRRAGSGAWAGIKNHFYWVDPVLGKLGVIFTNLLPFLDTEVLDLFQELENGVYAA